VQRQVGQGGVAGEDPAANVGSVASALDVSVVGLRDACGQQEQGGARVGDGRVRDGDERATCAVAGRVGGLDREARSFELPEALGRIDVDKGERTGELGLIDEAKVVVAGWRDV